MQRIEVASEVDNLNIPLDPTTDRLRTILNGISPSAFYIPLRRYFDVSTSGRLNAWYDAFQSGRKLVPAQTSAPLVQDEAVTGTITGGITVVGSLNYFDVTAISGSVPIEAGAVLLTGASVSGTKVIRQLSGTVGGVGRYIVDQKQTVAAGTSFTASAYASINLTATDGQALIEYSGADVWPSAGSAGSIASLCYLPSTLVNGAIASSLSTTYRAYFNNVGIYNYQSNSGGTTNGRFNGATDFRTNAWHRNIARWPAAGLGSMLTDGAADGSTGTVAMSEVADGTSGARRLVVGSMGPTYTNDFRGRIAAILITSIDLNASGNTSLLAAVNDELAAWQAKF